MRLWPPLLLGSLTALLVWGCTGAPWGPVRREIAAGDRQKDWALVYYESWRRDGKGDYLRLARRQMADAIRTYFDIQVRIGHSYPDFYRVDRKRRESCRFLHEIDRDAGRFRIPLEDVSREGCLR